MSSEKWKKIGLYLNSFKCYAHTELCVEKEQQKDRKYKIKANETIINSKTME